MSVHILTFDTNPFYCLYLFAVSVQANAVERRLNDQLMDDELSGRVNKNLEK